MSHTACQASKHQASKPRRSKSWAGLILALIPALELGAAQAAAVDPALLARGAYIARAADCASCHRGDQDGAPAYSGGLAIATPMGDIIATNITPSPEHGIGRYSEAEFKRAVTRGIRRDGTHLYPAMPYTAYQGMTDADIHALYTWLHDGVAPSDHQPPPTRLPLPWSLRPLMAGWNLLNARLPPPLGPNNTPQLRRGYYLTEVLGHCSACHSPRNLLMGESGSKRYSGGDLGGWHAPNITASRNSGIGGWSDQELVRYLGTGRLPGKAVASGGMAEAVDYGLSHLDKDDLQAIVAYLRQIPAVDDPADTVQPWTHVRPAAVTAADQAGRELYLQACATCHRSAGEGAYNQTFPSLTANSTSGGSRPNNLIMVILTGVERHTPLPSASMPGFATSLSDAQVAALTNYLLHSFGNAAVQVDAAKVKLLREGGAKPPLVRLLPWLGGLGGLVLILLVILLVRRIQRKGAAQ